MTSTMGRPGRGADELLADWADVAGRARRPMEAPTTQATVSSGGIARLAGVGVLALGVVVAAQALVPRGDGSAAGIAGGPSPSVAASPDACPVTVPNLAHGGAWPDTLLDHGADGLFTALAPGGTIVVPRADVHGTGIAGTGLRWHTQLVHRDGAAVGPVSVTGRPIVTGGGGEADVAAEFPDGQGDDPILRVDLGFPADGCWEVTLHAGTAELAFVARVVTEAAAPASPVAGPSAAP